MPTEKCPTCNKPFRNGHARGAHYRVHPDHRPAHASGTSTSSEATKPEARRRDAGTVELPVAERTIGRHTVRLVIVAPAELQPIVELIALAHGIDLTGK